MTTSFRYEPAVPDRKIGVRYGRPPNHKRDSTLKHLAQGDFPINLKHIRDICSRIENGLLTENRALLIEEVKKDPALFLHCTKHIQATSTRSVHPSDPFQELLTLENEQLSALFSRASKTKLKHSLAKANSIQAVQSSQMALSTTAAEGLASRIDFNPNIAYAASAFHNLGAALLAWNYPAIYSLAVSQSNRHGIPLDTQLRNALGITPHEIEEAFGGVWGMMPDVMYAFHQKSAQGHFIAAEGGKEMTLKRLCETAELYAQTKDPAHFPDAESKWSNQLESLENNFGANFRDDLDSQIVEPLRLLAQEAPATQKLTITKELFGASLSISDSSLPPGNSYIARCTIDIQREFQEVYRRIEPGKISVDAIRILVDSVIQKCGFDRGCLYLLDNDKGLLRPALRVGDIPLARYPICLLNESNEIGASVFSAIPVKFENKNFDGEIVNKIVAGLQNKNHPGVLYLEFSDIFSQKPLNDSVLLFQAIRASLDDCLGD